MPQMGSAPFEEAADLRFEHALMLVIALLSDTLKEEHIGLTEEQMQQIMDSFIEKLPGHIRDCLSVELHFIYRYNRQNKIRQNPCKYTAFLHWVSHRNPLEQTVSRVKSELLHSL